MVAELTEESLGGRVGSEEVRAGLVRKSFNVDVSFVDREKIINLYLLAYGIYRANVS